MPTRTPSLSCSFLLLLLLSLPLLALHHCANGHIRLHFTAPLLQIAALPKEHAVLPTKRQELEAVDRRVAIDECGMDEAHAAVVSKEAAMKEAESAAAASATAQQLQGKVRDLET